MTFEKLIALNIISIALSAFGARVPSSFSSYKHIQIPYESPAKAQITKAILPEAEPNYQFEYKVNDNLSGDRKTQQEIRRGDVVFGSYSFIEADGTKRIVEYRADNKNGFNAVVRKEAAPENLPPSTIEQGETRFLLIRL